jgi:O-methyltransferase domain
VDWAAFKNDEVVVDVGGSVGSLTLLLTKTFPHLKYIVQDLDEVIPDGEKVISYSLALATDIWMLVQFWAAESPELIANGRVALQGVFFPLALT